MQRERTVSFVKLDDIVIDEGPRPLNEEAVARLARSMSEIGMHTPISVVFAGFAKDHNGNNNRTLLKVVSGRHRIAAAKSLGWSEIEAIRFDYSPHVEALPDDANVDALAEMWAIAENLHRLDLTKDERDRQIRRYAELLEAIEATKAEAENQVEQNDPPEIGYKQPPPQVKGIARRIADETGLSKSTVRRALSRPDPEIERQQQEAARVRREQDRAIETVAAEEFAGWLLRNGDLDALPQIISWLEGTKPRDVINALHRLSNPTPVIDHGDDPLAIPEFLRRTA